MNDSNILVIIAVIIVLLFFVISVLFWLTPHGSNPKLPAYITSIGVIALIVTVIAFFINSYYQKSKRKEESLLTDRNLNREYLMEVSNKFANDPELGRLAKEIHPDNDLTHTKEITPSITNKEFHMAMYLTRMAADICSRAREYYNHWDSVNLQGWLNILRTWYKSDIMIKFWNKNKSHFNPETRVDFDKYILNKDVVDHKSMREIDSSIV